MSKDFFSSSPSQRFSKPVNNYWTFTFLLLFVLFLVDGFNRETDFGYHKTKRGAVVNVGGAGEEEEQRQQVLGRAAGEDFVEDDLSADADADAEDNRLPSLKSFDIAKIAQSKLEPNSENLKFIVIEGLIEGEKLREILNDFPPALDSTTLANKKNVEKRDVLKTGQVKGTYAELLKDVESDAFRDAVGAKFGINLKGWHNRVTLRGACEPNPCGGMDSIHVDHKAKAVSILIYLNENTLDETDYHGGDLLFLKNKKSLDDANVVARVPSFGGTKIGRAHVRTPVTEKSRMPSSA